MPEGSDFHLPLCARDVAADISWKIGLQISPDLRIWKFLYLPLNGISEILFVSSRWNLGSLSSFYLLKVIRVIWSESKILKIIIHRVCILSQELIENCHQDQDCQDGYECKPIEQCPGYIPYQIQQNHPSPKYESTNFEWCVHLLQKYG